MWAQITAETALFSQLGGPGGLGGGTTACWAAFQSRARGGAG